MALHTERRVKKEDRKPTDTASPRVKSARRRHLRGESLLALTDVHIIIQARVDRPRDRNGTLFLFVFVV